MKNLLAATQTAYFTALKPLADDADLTAIVGAPVRVYTHVPENTQPPFLKIGQLSSESEAEGYDQVERITVEVIAVFRGSGNTPLLAMMHAARAVLDGQSLESDDASIQPPFFQSAEVGDPINVDGLTYLGIQSFESLVEPSE
jgi:hypothetical protein